jgi:hypothetical protein
MTKLAVQKVKEMRHRETAVTLMKITRVLRYREQLVKEYKFNVYITH